MEGHLSAECRCVEPDQVELEMSTKNHDARDCSILAWGKFKLCTVRVDVEGLRKVWREV